MQKEKKVKRWYKVCGCVSYKKKEQLVRSCAATESSTRRLNVRSATMRLGRAPGGDKGLPTRSVPKILARPGTDVATSSSLLLGASIAKS